MIAFLLGYGEVLSLTHIFITYKLMFISKLSSVSLLLPFSATTYTSICFVMSILCLHENVWMRKLACVLDVI